VSGPELWVGDESDPKSHERRVGERVVVEAEDLTTHGMIVGMT